MTDWNYDFPTASLVYTVLIAHLNSACNPILYAIFNPGFKKGYGNIIKYFLRKSFDSTKLKSTIKIVSRKDLEMK